MSNPIPGDALFLNPGGVFSAGNPAFILTATTTGTAHTLHTAVTGTADVDLVTLWVWNNSGSGATLTLEVGGVTVGPATIAANAPPAVILSRLPMSNAITLKAFAGTTSVLGVAISTTRLIEQTQ